MVTYLLRRLLSMIPVLIGITLMIGVVVGVELIGRWQLERMGVTEAHSIPAIRGTGVIRLAQMAAVFVPLAVVRRVGPRALGVRAGEWRRGIAWAAGVSAALLTGFALAAVGSWLWDRSNLVAIAFGESPLALATTARSRALVLAAMVVVGPFAEEVFFRGYMQTRLRLAWGAGPAIVATSLAFALLHMEWVHAAMALVLGLYLGALTERTGSALPAIVCHVVNNSVFTVVTAVTGTIDGRRVNALLLGVSVVVFLTCAAFLTRRLPRAVA